MYGRVPYATLMREPVSEGKVSLEAYAKDVMKKGGVELQGPEYIGSPLAPRCPLALKAVAQHLNKH